MTVAVVLQFHRPVTALFPPQTCDALRPVQDHGKANSTLTLDSERLFQSQDTNGREGRMGYGKWEMGSNDEQRVREQLRGEQRLELVDGGRCTTWSTTGASE